MSTHLVPKSDAKLPNYYTPAGDYNQLRQNYLNNDFQVKVGKELPKQFPEPLSVRNLDVGNFAFSDTANTLQARNYLKYFQGGSKSVTYLISLTT